MSVVRELFSNPSSALFATALKAKGGRPRKVQLDYAQAVEQLLDTPGGIGILQGETGSGKTLGYLVPSILKAAQTDGLVVISTNTLSLQNQLIRDALPGVVEMVAGITGRRLKVARRIGRQNFISLPAMAIKIDALDLTADQDKLLRQILSDLSANHSRATRLFVNERYGAELTELDISPSFFETLQIGQAAGDDEAYGQMLEEAQDCDVLVINHALLVYNLMMFGDRAQFGVSPERVRPVTLIVDEADTLASMAAQMITRKLPLRELAMVADRIDASAKDKAKLSKAVAGIATEFQNLAGKADRINMRDNSALLAFDKAADATAQATISKMLQTIESVASRCLKDGKIGDLRIFDVKAVLSDIASIQRCFKAARDGEAPKDTLSLYWSPVRAVPGFHIDAGHPGRIISRLWRHEDAKPATLLLTSATLTTDRDRGMADFAREIGMSKEVEIGAHTGVFSPSKFGTMSFVVVDPRSCPPVMVGNLAEDAETTKVTNPAIIPWWTGVIRQAAARGGRVLVLLPSHKDAGLVHAALGAVPGRRVLLDSRDTAGQNLRDFAADETTILISAIRWEGLDLPGKIKHIVIPRFPLAPPDIFVDALREMAMLERGISKSSIQSGRFFVSMAQARRRFAQGIGRGIRGKLDSVQIWIGDPRWPMSADRRDKCPEAPASPSWASVMQQAIPTRFQASLDNALAYDLKAGVTPFTRVQKDIPRGLASGPRLRISKPGGPDSATIPMP